MVRRIAVKVGSSSLTDDTGRISLSKMQVLVEQLVRLQRNGQWQPILVSSGAVAAGIERLGWRRETITMPEKQAAAAVGQGILLDAYQRLFADHGIAIAQLLLTRADIEDRKRFIHIRNTFETLLRAGVVPIINENDTVAVEEIRFGDNDTLASLVALLADADLLVLLTDIDGLYTGHPQKDPSASLLTEVAEITQEIEDMAGDAGSRVGTGGMRTKITAAKIATASGIDTVVASGADMTVLSKIAQGDAVGTRFLAKSQKQVGKKSWMAHGSKVEGRIWLDAGATRAVAEQSRSLLWQGITEIEGDFAEGAIVEMIGSEQHLIGKGASHFSSWDLRMLLERKRAGEPIGLLHEVIHRNQMVLTQRGVIR